MLTPAKVYVGLVWVTSGQCTRAYESKRRRQWLKSQGINDRIMHRSHSTMDSRFRGSDELISPLRALV